MSCAVKLNQCAARLVHAADLRFSAHSHPVRRLRSSATEVIVIVEPISKFLEKHRDASELGKSEDVEGVVLPANEEPRLPLQPGKEMFDKPAALMST